MSVPVLEQLRTLDGQLFQNESTLSVYLDIKAFVWTHVSSALRSDKARIGEYTQWTDDTATRMTDVLYSLRPTLEHDLQGVLETYKNLLKATEQTCVVVNRSTVSKVLQGLFRRVLAANPTLDYDIIKIDFLFREAFRMTLYHDCMIIVSAPLSVKFAPVDDTHAQDETPSPSPTEDERRERTPSPRERTPTPPPREPTPPPPREPTPTPPSSRSTTPERKPAVFVDDDKASVVSRAMDALSSLQSFKKPRVRTVIFTDDDSVSIMKRR